MREIVSGVLGGEPIVDPGADRPVPLLPGSDFRLQGGQIEHTPDQTLAAQRTLLDLGHMQPTAALGHMAAIIGVNEALGPVRGNGRVECSGGVGAERGRSTPPQGTSHQPGSS